MRAVVLPYIFYAVLALAMLDMLLNRVIYFLTRYESLGGAFYPTELYIRAGIFSFIFSEFASMLLLVMLTIFLSTRRGRPEFYIALPLAALSAANIMRYLFRSSSELYLITFSLNVLSLAIILLSVFLRLRWEGSRRSSVKASAYFYLSFLTAILVLQHLYQLYVLPSEGGLTPAGGPILEVIPNLMLINILTIIVYSLAVSYRELPALIRKPIVATLSLAILSAAGGLLYINSTTPQALSDMAFLIFTSSLHPATLTVLLIGVVPYFTACLLLWASGRHMSLHRQEAIGLLLIFAANFFFVSIYYYPRVAIGIILIAIPLIEVKQPPLQCSVDGRTRLSVDDGTQILKNRYITTKILLQAED